MQSFKVLEKADQLVPTPVHYRVPARVYAPDSVISRFCPLCLCVPSVTVTKHISIYLKATVNAHGKATQTPRHWDSWTLRPPHTDPNSSPVCARVLTAAQPDPRGKDWGRGAGRQEEESPREVQVQLLVLLSGHHCWVRDPWRKSIRLSL